MQERQQVVVFVVAAHALRERLRGDELASFDAELQRVRSPRPGQRIRHLIGVLHRTLWRIRIRSDLQLAQVIDLQIREAVESRRMQSCPT